MHKILILLAILGAFGTAHAATLSDSGVLLDRIVAVVNEGIIMQSQLDAKVTQITRQLSAQGTTLPPRSVLEQQVLEQLILQEVQLQRARRLGIRVTDEQLNGTLSRVARRNGITLSELPATMAAQGIDYARYREDMRDELTLEALHQRDVMTRINVSDREIQRYLERQAASAGDQLDYDLSHILIAVPSDATGEEVQQARERALELKQRIEEGADFAELAVAWSEGQNALQGGHLGWRKGSQLPPEFFREVREMNPGDVAGPLRTGSGFHVIRLNDVRGAEKVVELQTHVRHILMRPNEIMDEQTVRQELERLRERILEGEDFADVARLHSQDPGSAINGGDLGWSSPGSFVPEFEEQLAQLEKGDISEPFRTPYGWHIVQLLDRAERDTTEEVRREQAVQAIRSGKLEQETDIWLRELRDEAYVEIRG